MKDFSHMKGCCAITVLTEIKHFLREKKDWNVFLKGFSKRSSSVLVLGEP